MATPVHKSGSDIESTFQYLDLNNNAITLANLEGFGIKIYNPNSGILAKFGVNLNDDSFVENTDYFEAISASEAILRLPTGSYPKQPGNYTAELVIKYLDDNYPDGTRDIITIRKIIFKLER